MYELKVVGGFDDVKYLAAKMSNVCLSKFALPMLTPVAVGLKGWLILKIV